MNINYSYLDCDKEYLGLSLIDITKDTSLDIFVINLPENLISLFQYIDKEKYYPITELNEKIKVLNKDCFANYQNCKNHHDGWIFILNNPEYDIDRYLGKIKLITTNWMYYQKEKYKEEIESKRNKNKDINIGTLNAYEMLCDDSFIAETANQICAERKNIKITLDSLKKDNSMEKNLYLFRLGGLLANRLKTTIGPRKEVYNKDEYLSFYKVNLLHNNSTARLMAFMDKPITVDKVTYYYTYYVDLNINYYNGDKFPRLMISPKSSRLRAEDNTLDYFKTSSKNIYPYIFLPSGYMLNKDDSLGSFIQGRILNSDNNPRWDSFFEKSFKSCLIDLPSVTDIYNNPLTYLHNPSILNVYIPHGTHFYDANHNTNIGVDVLKRQDLCSEVHNILLKHEDTLSNEIAVIEKYGTTKKILRKIRKDVDNLNLIENNTFEFDLLYISESLKILLEKFQNHYNSWDFSDLDMREKADGDYKKMCYSLRAMLEGTKTLPKYNINKNTTLEELEKMDTDPIKTPPKIKFKINFIDMNNSLDLNLNINKYPDKEYLLNTTLDKKELEKEKAKIQRKHIRNVEKISKLNKKNVNSKLNTQTNSALVEVNSKETYRRNKQIDMKKPLRNYLCGANKVSQFINYHDKKSNPYSWCNIIKKCITELMRQEGYLLVTPSNMMENYEKLYKIENTYENSLHIGVCYISSFKKLSLVAIYKNQIFGIDESNDMITWVPYNKSLCALGNNILSKEETKNSFNKYYLEKAINSLYNQLTMGNDEAISHVILYTDGSSLRRKLPSLVHSMDSFNLLLAETYKDTCDIINENSILNTSLLEKLSVVMIEGESSGRCPEWVEIKKGTLHKTGLSSAFCKLNDKTFLSIADKQSFMHKSLQFTKETAPDRVYRKETAVLISVVKNKSDYPELLLAAYAHLLRMKNSIQHNNGATTFPLPLDLAKKNAEYLFYKNDIILGDDEDCLDDELSEYDVDNLEIEEQINSEDSLQLSFDDITSNEDDEFEEFTLLNLSDLCEYL